MKLRRIILRSAYCRETALIFLTRVFVVVVVVVAINSDMDAELQLWLPYMPYKWTSKNV